VKYTDFSKTEESIISLDSKSSMSWILFTPWTSFNLSPVSKQSKTKLCVFNNDRNLIHTNLYQTRSHFSYYTDLMIISFAILVWNVEYFFSFRLVGVLGTMQDDETGVWQCGMGSTFFRQTFRFVESFLPTCVAIRFMEMTLNNIPDVKQIHFT
jgi:hypothetical protein